ncbi:MAG: excinuclease ABC subunit UvrC [Actinomycetota bacterium]|nr:excinuclease ABC subunit UvrC [Actinomycetota bacterium]
MKTVLAFNEEINKKLKEVNCSEQSTAEEFLKIIPKRPGVYIFKDSRGTVIYIGKAKNLYNRVKSYFKGGSKNIQYAKPFDFVKRIKSIDYVVTDNEAEALILENSLIKKIKPKYNVELKDDKSYPFIAVTVGEEFPRVFLTRDRNIAGARYFGPYTNAGAVRETIKYLRKIFPVRDCKGTRPGKSTNIPCLNYYIKLCPAPCTGNITPEEYRKNIELIILFLKGKDNMVADRLNSEMMHYSENKEFEKAAEIRNRIESINKLSRSQKIFFTGGSKWDFISTALDTGSYANDAVVSLFTYRSGELSVINNFTISNVKYLDEGEIISAFIRDYYENIDDIPEKIYCKVKIEDSKLISEWLTGKAGRKVELLVPEIGEKKEIMEMVTGNSVLYLEKKKFEKDIMQGQAYKNLVRLKKLLGLINIPERIECYDISNIKDSYPVGSMSVAVNGKLINSNYRQFKIKTIVGQDDCSMIGEVVSRRLAYFGKESDKNKSDKIKCNKKGIKKEDDSFSIKPDLIVIDGGKAQYNAAKRILIEKQIDDIDLVSIAKKEEVIFCEKYPEGKKLDLSDSSIRILIRVRDEAHRFAVKYHRMLRGKGMYGSELDGIKGIGEKKKRAIFESVDSIEKLNDMGVEDLLKIKGLSHRDVLNIYNSIHKAD